LILTVPSSTSIRSGFKSFFEIWTFDWNDTKS